jgi:hypothetical protein
VDSTKTGQAEPADPAQRGKRPQWLFPGITFVVVWLPMSFRSAYEFGRRVRLTGPAQNSVTPILDAWTQTAQGWIGPAAFAALFVFVVERWLEDLRRRRG